MARRLTTEPFFFILIPIFFVLHGCNENFGFIGIGNAFLLIFIYVLAALILFALFFFFFRNKTKAALPAGYLIAVYLFFGYVKDFLKIHLPGISKYAVLLTILLISIIILVIFLAKTKRTFSRIVLYLNLLLSIFVFMDVAAITMKTLNPPADKFSIFPVLNNQKNIISNSEKPDIYFLIFDEYASSIALKEKYNFENDLDSFLEEKGFQIQKHSFSNYDFTHFSMASTLNMSYLNGIRDSQKATVDDYGYCQKLISNNEVIRFLSANGYEIVNYSIFDLKGNPSPVNQTLLPLKTRLITDNTLFSRIIKDMSWMLYKGHFAIKSLAMKHSLLFVKSTNASMDSVLHRSLKISNNPTFVYAHLFMPHAPFFYDKNGSMRNLDTVALESVDRIDAYLGYLQYTNKKIKDLITQIQNNTRNNAVIILMGDHGFRRRVLGHDSYQNMNAVFFPKKNYGLLYDSISNVNQFRVIFNSLFKQSFDLLKDSTIYLDIPH